MGLTVDASVLVDALGGKTERGQRAAKAIVGHELYAPSTMHVEVIGGLRKQLAMGNISAERASVAIRALKLLDIEILDIEPLIDRIWQLRNNLSPADASYVALAEKLGVPLVTFDARMAAASGTRCDFKVLR